MDVQALTIGVIGIAMVLAILCYILYTYFPLTIVKQDGRTVEYRHEFLIFFFIIFMIQALLFIPQAAIESNDNCGVEINNSVSVVYLNTTQTNYTYSTYCENATSNSPSSLFEYYSNLRWFFWTYLTVYVMASIFIYIRNYMLSRRV